MPKATKYKVKVALWFKTHVENPYKMLHENTKVNKGETIHAYATKFPMDTNPQMQTRKF